MKDWTQYEKRPVFLTDGWEYVRTVPSPVIPERPFRSFVRTTLGEGETSIIDGKISKVVFDCQLHGREITEEEYRVARPDRHGRRLEKIL